MCETPVNQMAGPLPCVGTNWRTAICSRMTFDSVVLTRTYGSGGVKLESAAGLEPLRVQHPVTRAATHRTR